MNKWQGATPCNVMQCWGQRPGRQRVTIEGSAMQCKQLKVFSQRSGRWMVARYCRKAWNPIAWWPKKAKVIERSADLYSCFTAYKERLLAKDGWTVCRNLTDQTLLLSVKDEFLGWVAESDVWMIYPKEVHPWHLWPLCWNHLNNVPFPWGKKCYNAVNIISFEMMFMAPWKKVRSELNLTLPWFS